MALNQKIITSLVLILGCYQIEYTQALGIPTFDLRLKDLLKLQQGLGWPSELLVAEGQEALMRLTDSLGSSQTCTVTTPTGLTFNVATPPSNRYEHWSDGCGLRVREVVPSDVGRWRLTATLDTHSIEGWVEVTVREDVPSYTAPPITLLDGSTQATVDLISLDNSYCVVTQPFSESSLVPGHCRVTLDKTTRAVQGNWNVVVGLPGRVAEIRMDRQVAVQAERLDTGYIHEASTNKVHLYCNILHTAKNITFCRFQLTTSSLGYNVMEGLSDGAYSYYGDGFVARECGMTIEHPTAEDFGTWRCSVGSQDWVGTVIQQQTPMQALINVVANSRTGRQDQDVQSDVEEDTTVFVQEGLSFTVMCRSQVSLSYCWFLHPNGSHFSPMPRDDSNQHFWYTGESLQTGDCGITFSRATDEDAGHWACHMGATDQMGLEQTDRVNVRVTGPLAASRKELDVAIGQNATLHCHTANGNRPLDYCRFLTPQFVGISIDSSISRENAILDRFYFSSDRSLDYGDCSLTIIAVQPEDIGMWTCAALINSEASESSDTMELLYSASPTRAALSQAGVAGMSLGIFALVALLFGVVWHKIGRPVPWRRDRLASGATSAMPFDLMSNFSIVSGNRSSVASSVSSNNSNSSASGEIAGPAKVDNRVRNDPLGVGISK